MLIHASLISLTLVGKSSVEKSSSVTQKETFDGSRKDINAAIDQICEFSGKRVMCSF